MALVTRRSSLRASSAQPSALSRKSGWFLTTASSSSWRTRQVLAPLGSLHTSASLQDNPNPTFPAHGPGKDCGDGSATCSSVSALLLKATRGLDSDLTAQAMACLALEGVPWAPGAPTHRPSEPGQGLLGQAGAFPACGATLLPFPDKSPVIVVVMCQGTGSRTCSHRC